MHSLPHGYAFTQFERHDHLELFERVEDMARDVGTGADAMSEDQYLIAVLSHPSCDIAGAVWADCREGFTFHVAVEHNHQGNGLSHILIEQAMQEYRRVLNEDPTTQLQVTAIDPRITYALYQHGFIAVENWGDESFPFSYLMKPVDNLADLILQAHSNDTSLFFDAITLGSQLSGISEEDVAIRLKTWTDAPIGEQKLELPVPAATALLKKLPLATCHLDFLQAQHRLTNPDVPRPVRAVVELESIVSSPVAFKPKR